MKKFGLILIALFVLLVPSLGLASAETDYPGAEYIIKDYQREITVQENNSYLIKDVMTVDWIKPAHGLKVEIPLKPEYKRRVNGKIYTDTYQVVVSNVNAEQPFDTERNGELYTIKMGNPDEYVSGVHTYSYEYVYDVGDDRQADFDEFYYSLVTATWPVPIEKLSFKIHMPKEFDASKIGFTTGAAGNAGYNQDALKFTVNGNTITGEVNQTIAPYEAVTIRIELPNGYYVGARTAQSAILPCILIGVAMLLIVILLYATSGRKPGEVQTVEFRPPEGMNPADVGFIIDGMVEDKDAVSLLIYWADQGNLEIHQEDKKNVSFKKLKDLPDTANDYERILFDKMFVGRENVSIKDMQYEFASTISAVKERIKDKYEVEENRIFTKKSLSRQRFAGAFAFFPMVLAVVFSSYMDTYEWFLPLFIGAVAWGFGYVFTFSLCGNVNKWKSEKLSTKMGSLIVSILLIAIELVVICLLSVWLFGAWIAIPAAASVVMILLATQMRRRTQRGAQWAGRILGLKHFIETVEADKLKMMVSDDPSYFYSILPYAYVLGVSDKWAKQFEAIAVQPPSWYYGYDGSLFTTIWFASMLSNTMHYTQQTMVTPKSSGGGGFGGIGGGGGFGGGGFSGGGGGAGGGSW